MAVEYNPNDYVPATPTQTPQVSPHGPAPVQPQAYPQTTPRPAPQPSPHPVQPPMPQAQPAPSQPMPYNPAPQQAQPQPQPNFQYTAPQPAPQAPAYPPQAQPHAYGAQPAPHHQAPHGAHQDIAEAEAPKSRFKRKKKASKTKQPRDKAADGQAGFLKPYLLGLASGALLMFGGLSVMGGMAKKNAQQKFNTVAAAVQQPDLRMQSNVTVTGEEIVIADTTPENPERPEE